MKNKIWILIIVFVLFFTTSCKKKEEKKYTVNFYDEETLLKTEQVREGTSATAPDPKKEGFDFTGWDVDFSNITSDLDVHASYTTTICIVTFMVDGKQYDEKTVNYGESVQSPSKPRKTGYLFSKWDQDLSCVKSDLIVNAVFDKRMFTVNFIGVDGNTIKSEKVAYQESATAPESVEIDNYRFIEWDQDFSCITDNIDINAVYKKINRSISYFFGENEVNVEPKAVSIETDFTLPNLTIDGYEFLGWYLDPISLTKITTIKAGEDDLKFYAKYVEVTKHEDTMLTLPDAKYHFTGIKKVENSGTVTTYLYQPIFPTEMGGSVTEYNWFTSDQSIAIVSAYSSISVRGHGYCVLTAVNKTNPQITINCIIRTSGSGVEIATLEQANTIELVTATFKDNSGNVIESQKVMKGSSAILPIPPVVDGKMFIGWDKDNYNLTEDTIFNARYEVGSSYFQGKTFAFIGDSISTYAVNIPTGFDTFYPYASADVFDVNQTWWMRVVNSLGGSLFVNNSWSGSCVCGVISSASQTPQRLKYTQLQNQSPDVIMIYMGNNDCASSVYDEAEFNKCYNAQIDNLKKICPDSEIILLTLCETSFYKQEKKEAFNNVIKTIGNQRGLMVVDMGSTSLNGHKVDTAHFDDSGMKIFADEIVKQLRKKK